jgi:hypothetical protein
MTDLLQDSSLFIFKENFDVPSFLQDAPALLQKMLSFHVTGPVV